ncbi:MAG: hypothetical protein JJT88_13960 [Gammaproteobacteria bacterium]|nr:hypothetical protein [Gammaproteobacteria bacterium]
MNDRLYLFAPASDDADWAFCLLQADGESLEGRGLETAAAAPSTEGEQSGEALQAILVVPAECLLRTAVTVPARGRRQIEMAVPYLVEEHLAEDVERLHLALGTRREDGRVPVAVVDPERLQVWLDAVKAAGVEVSAAHCAIEGWLGGPADLRILVDVDTAWVGCRTGDGVAVDRSLLLHVLSQWVGRQEAKGETDPVSLDLWMPEGDSALDLAQLESALAQIRPVTIERGAYPGSSRKQLALALQSRSAVDLLQGRFAVAGTAAHPWYRWRLVAGLTAGLLLLQMGLDVARTSWLEQRAMTLRQESVALFQEIYPERTRVPDPRRELEALLEGGGTAGAAFLDLLGASATRISALEDGPLQLRSLTFNAQRGDLALDLNASGISSVDRFKDGMEAQGYPVVIDSAVQEAQTVRARLRVRAGGA